MRLHEEWISQVDNFVGMYWCCAGPTLIVDIEKAVDHYVKKYGRVPEYCFIESGKEGEVGGVKIRLREGVLRGHLWIGNYEEPD